LSDFFFKHCKYFIQYKTVLSNEKDRSNGRTVMTRCGRTRSYPKNPSDPSGSESDTIQSDFLRKSNWSDPNLTWPDPTWDQMVFNPIEIYQQYEKTQHVNWPDPTRPDPISSRMLNWSDLSDSNPNPTLPALLPPLVMTLAQSNFFLKKKKRYH
jgi:hypothetical protein